MITTKYEALFFDEADEYHYVVDESDKLHDIFEISNGALSITLKQFKNEIVENITNLRDLDKNFYLKRILKRANNIVADVLGLNSQFYLAQNIDCMQYTNWDLTLIYRLPIVNQVDEIQLSDYFIMKRFFKTTIIEYISQLIEINNCTVNNLNENESNRPSCYPLNTNLDYNTREFLYNSLIVGKFIESKTDKESFIWAFGESDKERPTEWDRIQWNESKLAFVELVKPILGIITNKHKRNIANLFLDKHGNSILNIKTPKKDEVSARYGDLCKIIEKLEL